MLAAGCAVFAFVAYFPSIYPSLISTPVLRLAMLLVFTVPSHSWTVFLALVRPGFA
ncbi:hypothetical protein F4820DRAFT_406753 [Hypoxylon rubiginosum]|uniref:Uncharacterized protein n=1 Tax=Hypoxylon rubiginosum TaxID=110542 RepID=A0ACB9ZD74_9PEZI|nr:hypothetical protein F4820DRAFT_406753 [Hypoxylon rubiginosum]